MLLADIANGNTEWADIFFLAAFIVAVLAVVVSLVVQPRNLMQALLAGAVGLTALGLLVL